MGGSVKIRYRTTSSFYAERNPDSGIQYRLAVHLQRKFLEFLSLHICEMISKMFGAVEILTRARSPQTNRNRSSFSYFVQMTYDPSSATRRPGRNDGNRDAMAGFIAANG
jgi:hypothetical protein